MAEAVLMRQTNPRSEGPRHFHPPSGRGGRRFLQIKQGKTNQCRSCNGREKPAGDVDSSQILAEGYSQSPPRGNNFLAPSPSSEMLEKLFWLHPCQIPPLFGRAIGKFSRAQQKKKHVVHPTRQPLRGEPIRPLILGALAGRLARAPFRGPAFFRNLMGAGHGE